MKEILEKYGIKPSKRLGQNFLVDKSVLKKILEAAELSSKDVVLEIGPGLGILTVELAKRVKKVIAVEKDKKMCKVLLEMLDAGNVRNVKVVNKDILKIPDYELRITDYKLIANLPYYITSPVIRKFLEANPPAGGPKLMVLMVQKEVAQRICAKPGNMSILAVAVQFYAFPKIISYVSKKSFWPQPKVDSAVLKIVPRKSMLLSAPSRDKFFELVKTGFSSKRKMLKNNLKIEENALKKIGLNPKARAENLSVEDWLKLLKII